jgi:hypothetical protein
MGVGVCVGVFVGGLVGVGVSGVMLGCVATVLEVGVGDAGDGETCASAVGLGVGSTLPPSVQARLNDSNTTKPNRAYRR